MTRVILVKNGITIQTGTVKESLVQTQNAIMKKSRGKGIIDAYGNISVTDDNNDKFIFQIKSVN